MVFKRCLIRLQKGVSKGLKGHLLQANRASFRRRLGIYLFLIGEFFITKWRFVIGVFKVGRNKTYYIYSVCLPAFCVPYKVVLFLCCSILGRVCKQAHFFRKIKKAEAGRVKVVRICCDNLGLAYILEVIETSWKLVDIRYF